MGNKKVLEEIENTIKHYFNKKWNKKNISYFLDGMLYSPDITALNNNINIPIGDFIFGGGKRLRPILFITLLKIFKQDYKKYIDFAFLIELVHNGTLVIDDIEDDSELRRGKLTLHKKFGLDTAINAGVAMHFLPLKILIKNKLIPNNKKLRIWNAYGEEMINVHFGQGIDIYWHKNKINNISINKYLEMCRLKTGSLMRLSARLACIISNKSEVIEKKFAEFSELLGISFQIKDDILDLTSTSKKFGKSFGNDITEGKMSLPVIFALSKLSSKNKKRLLQILNLHTKNIQTINEALNMIKKTKAIEYSENFANKLLVEAWTKISEKILNKKDRDTLSDITGIFLNREY